MKRNEGFTLAELLLSLAITSVLVTLLVSVVAATTRVWQQGRNQMDTLGNARQVLGRIADELKGAITSSQAQFIENSPSLKGKTDPVAKKQENVFFVAPYPNRGAGDLCVIAYHLNNDTHELQRAFLDSETAWNTTPANRYQPSGYSTDLAPASAAWQTIARGVLEFEIIAFSQNDLKSGNNTPADTWDSSPTGTADMKGNVPRRIRIRIKVVDDKALARINAAPSSFNRIVNESAREFTADISLLSPK